MKAIVESNSKDRDIVPRWASDLRLERKRLREVLDAAFPRVRPVNALPWRNATIYRQKVTLHWTYRRIAEAHGISMGRVQQIVGDQEWRFGWHLACKLKWRALEAMGLYDAAAERQRVRLGLKEI